MAAFATCLNPGRATGQETLGLHPGMTYDEAKAFVTADNNLVYQAFDPADMVVSNTSRRYIPAFSASLLFCPGSAYDGKAITVITTERFANADGVAMVQRFHDLFQKMDGDQLGEVLSTRTEGDEARKQGTVGVSIKHRLKNGEIWDLGIFNREEPGEHFIQLVRTISPDAACKR